MIRLFPYDTTTPVGNGIGIVDVIDCEVEEVKNGMYAATARIPMRSREKNDRIAINQFLRIPCPVRAIEAFFNAEQVDETHWRIARRSYQVTNARLNRIPHPNSNNLYDSYTGTVYRLDDFVYNNRYARVSNTASPFLNSESQGEYILLSDLRNESSQNVTVDASVYYLIQPAPYTDQMFRIKDVEIDTTERVISVEAEHVFYDLEKAVCSYKERTDDYVTFDGMINKEITDAFCHKGGKSFMVLTKEAMPENYDFRETDFSKNVVQYLFDEKNGIFTQFGYTAIRDNYRIFALKDEELVGSVTLQTGKELAGVTYKINNRDLVYRVVPVGDKTGSGSHNVYYSGFYVDSPLAPTGATEFKPAKVILYNKDVEGSNTSNGLLALAQKEFAENHIDQPKVSVGVDYSGVVDEAFKKYRKTICMGNSINVIDRIAGIDVNVEMSRYVWDARPFAMRHKQIELGDLINLT